MVQGLYDFWLKELADYYIEAIKPVMKGNDEEAKKAALNTLYICLDDGLRMLHPTMPYITEELFQRLPHRKGEAPESITIAPFPQKLESYAAEGVEADTASLQLTVSKFRSQFSALNVPNNANPEIYIQVSNDKLRETFSKETDVFQSLIRSGTAHILAPSDADPKGSLKSYVNEDITIFVKVAGIIDVNLEVQRVNKRNAQLADLMEKLQKKMNMPGYLDKVPEKVRNDNQEKLEGYKAESDANTKGIEDLKKLL
mmetsp:Transcript_4545/g.6867  ORF Transcript_4545/g.6867 Transcript_4545/m.6867 type:complete len:256 (-) Transcript_4545:15-782(-)